MKMNRQETLFDALYESAKKNKVVEKNAFDALNWYRKKISALFESKSIPASKFFEKKNYPNKPIAGNIVTFRYSPKYQDTLKFYDEFPLALILKTFPDGFLGLNFHYLHPTDRAYFMNILYEYARQNVQYGTMSINVKYTTLKKTNKMNYYLPCIKRYLNGNINTMFYTLLPTEWDIALFLPTERFVGENKEQVWRESIDIIGKK